MTDRIATLLEYTVLGLFLLWAVGYLTRLIPRLCAGRVAVREREWTQDTVEYDRLTVMLALLPAIAAILPCLWRIALGIIQPHTLPLLLGCCLYIGAVLFRTSGTQLRYNDEGLYIRAASGKEYFLAYERVLSVEWQSGKRGKRSRSPLVMIRYRSELFGKQVTDTVLLDPARMRGIRRFLDAWRNYAESSPTEPMKESHPQTEG
ncbi:MAG: hypothetical protein J6K29_02970 [Clostridia bacterium]|nr:hypothetical protein [Clostridia bacterium]